MLLVLAFIGRGYIMSALETFPHHLLSGIFCFIFIIIIVLGLFDKRKYHIGILSIVTILVIALFLILGVQAEYETYRTLDEYGITFKRNVYVSFFADERNGNVELIKIDDNDYTVKIRGAKNAKYRFSLTDDNNTEYEFEYYYDENTVVLNRTN